MPSRLYTIPAVVPFAETLARGVIERLEAGRDPLRLADATIFLPTRRATRTLGEAFARVLGGAALLPQIRALGDPDDEFGTTDEDLSLPPAIDPVRRRLLLATLARRWSMHSARGALGFAQAAGLAGSLARFLDDAQTQNADLAKLEHLVPTSLAAHWSEVAGFLVHLREQWPRLLEREGALDPSDRRNLWLAALARRYRETPIDAPVIAAGTTGSIPATADLLQAIAGLPRGAVVLPALDRALDDESWERLDPGHAQYGLKQLLARMNVAREDVAEWSATPDETARTLLLREALRPAPTTDAWRTLAEGGTETIAQGLSGISVLEAAHPGEEASAIALALRHVLEKPAQTAALVTPDRGLARRVATEMMRWNIAIDDSAGMPLARTPPGAFLALLAEAADTGFAPVPLLSLFKHPLAAGGQSPAHFRRHARLLDRMVLRGPRPDAGLAGIAQAIERARGEEDDGPRATMLDAIQNWFADVAMLLKPLADAMAEDEVTLEELARLHLEAAEALAATDREKGAAILWRGDTGEALAKLMEQLLAASEDLPPVAPSSYPALFRMFAEEQAVRPAYGRHPSLAILGPLEARLQTFDLVILGGLNEGTWPRSVSADPWLSRPMRETLGLESPERDIGLAAHDFATLAAAPRVILSRALKVDGTPTVASRWLQRLTQLAKGLGLDERLHESRAYAACAQLFSMPDGAVTAEKRPEPRPPVAARPRGLSATGIETWIRDPYAIYAKHVLRLRPLDPLDAEIGALDRGNLMHAILEAFVRDGVQGSEALKHLVAIGDRMFAERAIPRSTLALWRPRFLRAAEWFVANEERRQKDILRSLLELRGETRFEGPAGTFTLAARADRIDLLRAGGAAIIDYKTGKPPTDDQVESFSPQLPLEALILERGGFAEAGARKASELVYIRFSGGPQAGDHHVVNASLPGLIATTEERLVDYIAAFDSDDTPYLPREAPLLESFAGDYDHLARVREWAVSGREDE